MREWRKVERIKWVDRMSNEDVLTRYKLKKNTFEGCKGACKRLRNGPGEGGGNIEHNSCERDLPADRQNHEYGRTPCDDDGDDRPYRFCFQNVYQIHMNFRTQGR